MKPFDPEYHANRYYKSLCLCDFPMRSKFARDLCAICGGIIPRYRQLEVEQAAERRADLAFTLFAIGLLVVMLVIDHLFPSVLDGAFSQIGR
jgi:hypothetical protein